MNYRHAFHAGNHADVIKHVALIQCVRALGRKPAAFAVLDAHAGRGFYALDGDEARRSPEWEGGVGRLAGWDDAPAVVVAYMDAVARAGAANVYPGSPALIAQELRAQDRLIACELQGEDFAALKRADFGAARVERHRRDAYEALTALTPFAERRGLVLVDPPYEAGDELMHAARAIKAILARFGHATVLWWRPLKDRAQLAIADAELGHAGLRADLWLDAPAREGPLVGSSLVIINAPFGLEDSLHEALPALAERMARGAQGWELKRVGR